MSYEAKFAMRWGAAIFAVAVVATIALVIWNVRAHKSTAPSKLTKAENTAPAAKPSSLPALANVSEIPKLEPGDTCEKAEKALGKPTEKDKFSRTWETREFVITAATDSDCRLTTIAISVLAGRKALLADGIILGESTLADVEKVPGKPLTERSESVAAAEGNWVGTLQFGPAAGMPFRTAYSAYLASGQADAMNHDPLISDFRDLPVTQYNLELVAPADSKK